jgi:hypothetical protein
MRRHVSGGRGLARLLHLGDAMSGRAAVAVVLRLCLAACADKGASTAPTASDGCGATRCDTADWPLYVRTTDYVIQRIERARGVAARLISEARSRNVPLEKLVPSRQVTIYDADLLSHDADAGPIDLDWEGQV